MSMRRTSSKSTKSDRAQNALTLAKTVQRRRENLGMSIERAADLAGMTVSQWFALESGWVPGSFDVLRAVAETLELGYMQLTFLAEISSNNQSRLV